MPKDLPFAFDSEPWYNPNRDGPLGEYISSHDGLSGNPFPLFKTFDIYQKLWSLGYLQPKISIIRVMWNVGRGDEHYLVINDETLKGIESKYHSGLPGFHSAKKVIERGPPWEAQNLSLNPLPKTLTQPYLPFPKPQQ